jgi:ankyrin repeat protein
MSSDDPLPYLAPLEDYQRQAEALLGALKSGDGDARWKFKWEHPRYRGKPVAEVDAAKIDLDDARLVSAHRYGFETWAALAEFTGAVKRDASVARFEAAVEAVISGALPALRSMLGEHPELARARSTRRHHATLLHYLAANGVESGRQKTPKNAVEVARTLLEAGAEVDALADMYDAKCTTMSMLVSSAPPAEAGLQAALAGTLLDHGAALDDGPGSNWRSALLTALVFGYLATAEALVKRGAKVDCLPAAAGLGRVQEAARLLPAADGRDRHAALAIAAQHGQVEVLRLLLDAGEDPSRYNPEGHHDHSTPLHQAVWSGHRDAVRLLVEKGARRDIRDTIYNATPLDWAVHGGRTEIAKYLRDLDAPAT